MSVVQELFQHEPVRDSALLQTLSDPALFAFHSVPVTQPVDEIITELNELDPDALLAYPSALVQLVESAQAGLLRITPRAIPAGGEPLLPETRASAEATFGVPILNWWLSSEALMSVNGCSLGLSRLPSRRGPSTEARYS